jgi:kynurenine formamidase
MADRQEPDPARLRQLAGRGLPEPHPQLSLPVHQVALVVHGVHLLENLKLDELAQKQVHEFAFMMQPLKMQGGTGSTVAPVAVR